MVRLISNSFRSTTTHIISHCRRALHGTYLLQKQQHSLKTTEETCSNLKAPSSRVKVTKTKKSYSELPKHLIKPDGTIAKPLEEWWDGGEQQSLKTLRSVNNEKLPTRRRTQTKVISVGTSEGLISEDGKTEDTEHKPKRRSKAQKEFASDDDKPKRRRRSRKAEQTGLVSEDLTPVPKKRRKTAVKPKKEPTKDPEEVEEFDDDQPRSALAKEITENLSKFPHCILLTRVGNFYESYFDQAKEVASLLNIKLASRKWGGGRVSMCGFPLQHIDKHLKILVQQNNRFVAMCEEFPRYISSGKREFERRVVRVITPGTLIDESFLNQYENNYLLSISTPSSGESNLGLAWIDVSTGEFYSKLSTYDTLRDEIARIGPREVILDKSLETEASNPAFDAIAEEHSIMSFVTPTTEPSTSSPSADMDTKSVLSTVTDEITLGDSSDPNPYVYSPEESAAIRLLTTYLQANLLDHMPPLRLPNQEDNGGRMQIDSHTIRALEIRESMREGTAKGSLMSVIKRTTTTSGTRLLSRWLCSPSTSIAEINARQSLVAFFCDRPHFRSDLLVLIARAEDASRIVQKFVLGKGEPSDLLALTSAIRTLSSVVEKVQLERDMEARERQEFNSSDEWASLDGLISRVVGLDELTQRIGTAIMKYDGEIDQSIATDDDFAIDPAADALNFNRFDWRFGRSRFGVKINPEFSEGLQSIHTTLQNLLNQKERLQERLQLKYDVPSLSLRSSPAQGMHVHLGKAKRDQGKLKNDSAFVPISETGTTKCYFYQEWSQLGSQIFDAAMNFAMAEREAFETLRQEITSHAASLRRNARILDELDVTLAFANLATEMKFVRPTLLDDTDYSVINGRHPTVELGLLTSGRVYTPNSVDLTPTSKLHVITGPNMAGKSTLLRQTALIAILAQTGSFVPADCATLGIVDKLFSRVGAKDDLFHDRSTFMVEMLETAEILRRATPRSLVIMDEVGRGTTVNDGLAIAFATVHHLVSVNQCRALFATHFHELSDMLGYTTAGQGQGQGVFANVSFYCTDVDELEDGSFTYSYRVRPGVNRDSHGLKVAQLAGMPNVAISVARNVLEALRTKKAQEYDASALESLGRSIMNKHHSPNST
ncbi:dna mismatch repair protein [Moniliophthora roreri MCA 2997]|uniref:Dna mismatch repair protein n=1 Tax=Moniliophthora roreri (strain MCA 2997) TaxID=1381753 RepID=V2XZX3_MONRO|nr:dna mismatch repair protein [Moniliophthora roreri MCA 2997]